MLRRAYANAETLAQQLELLGMDDDARMVRRLRERIFQRLAER